MLWYNNKHVMHLFLNKSFVRHTYFHIFKRRTLGRLSAILSQALTDFKIFWDFSKFLVIEEFLSKVKNKDDLLVETLGLLNMNVLDEAESNRLQIWRQECSSLMSNWRRNLIIFQLTSMGRQIIRGRIRSVSQTFFSFFFGYVSHDKNGEAMP